MLTNAHGLLLGSRGRTAQDPSCLSSSSKYSERPNTMQFWIHVLFWHCIIRQAKANFSFLLLIATLSILQVHQGQTAQATNWSEIMKNWKTNSKRETGREKYPQSFKVQKVSLAGADKALLQLLKTQKPEYYCWETRGMTEILFIQFLISLLRLKLFFSFHLLKASAL